MVFGIGFLTNDSMIDPSVYVYMIECSFGVPIDNLKRGYIKKLSRLEPIFNDFKRI